MVDPSTPFVPAYLYTVAYGVVDWPASSFAVGKAFVQIESYALAAVVEVTNEFVACQLVNGSYPPYTAEPLFGRCSRSSQRIRNYRG